jgi:hypothetical protein
MILKNKNRESLENVSQELHYFVSLALIVLCREERRESRGVI